MFRVIFMVVCALPLAFFTANVVREQLSGGGDTPTVPSGNGDGGETVSSADVLERANADSRMLTALVDFDPLDADGKSNQPDLTKLAPTERFAEMKTGMDELKRARNLIQSYVDMFPLSDDEELEALKAFREEHSLVNFAGAKQLARVIDARTNILEDQIRCQDLLAKAEKSFQTKRYADCLKIISTIPRDVCDRETIKKIDDLENLAQFEQHWKRYRRQPSDPRAESDQLADLLKSTPDPPNDATSRKLAQWRARQEELVGEIIVEEMPEYDNVAEYAAFVVRAAKDFPKQARKVSDGFRNWLNGRMAKKDVPKYPQNFEEAETKKGEIISGIFIAIEKDVSYQYWKTDKEYKRGDPHSTIHVKLELKAKPEKPRDTKLVKGYNEALNSLMKNQSEQSRWINFAEVCEESSEKMQEYAAKKGQDKPAVTFKVEANEARAVLAAWNDVEAILRISKSRSKRAKFGSRK